MRPTLRRVLEVTLGTAAIALAVVWLSGGLGKRIAPDAPVALAAPAAGGERVTVQRVVEPAFEWTSATVASARRTAVSSRILARIESIRVRSGDLVHRGDVLIVLDARDLEARVREARQALRAAQAQRALAEKEAHRIEELFRQGVATQQRLDAVRSALRVAQAQEREREHALEEAKTALSHAVIRSPTDGRVIDRLAEPGDTAVPGQPLLRLYDPSTLRVEVPVRESLAVHLAVGDKLTVEIPAIGKRFEAPIDEIVPFAEAGARTLLVKARLPLEPNLYAGMYARVAIPAGTLERVVAPAAAIERIGQLEYATVLDTEGHPARRLVTTGPRLGGGRVEVLSGLAPGETLLLPAAGAKPASEAPASGPTS